MLWAEQSAKGEDFTHLDDRDVKELKENPFSKIVFFDSHDYYAYKIINIFRSLFFEYGAMSNHPTGFNYLAAKDTIKWHGLSAKETIPLIKNMFIVYRNNLA